MGFILSEALRTELSWASANTSTNEKTIVADYLSHRFHRPYRLRHRFAAAAESTAKNFGASGFMIGLIMASYSLMQFLFAPSWGRLSDRIGRRPVLLVSTAGAALSYVCFALGSALTGQAALLALLGSRLVAGICGANITVAQAYIADVTPPDQRSKKMGLIGMAFGLGFICGPALGAVQSPFFWPDRAGLDRRRSVRGEFLSCAGHSSRELEADLRAIGSPSTPRSVAAHVAASQGGFPHYSVFPRHLLLHLFRNDPRSVDGPKFSS
jgi:hypothetical protein